MPGNAPLLLTVLIGRLAERVSELLPSALFALLLSFFGLASVFAATGLLMLAIGLTARLLSRRL